MVDDVADYSYQSAQSHHRLSGSINLFSSIQGSYLFISYLEEVKLLSVRLHWPLVQLVLVIRLCVCGRHSKKIYIRTLFLLPKTIIVTHILRILPTTSLPSPATAIVLTTTSTPSFLKRPHAFPLSRLFPFPPILVQTSSGPPWRAKSPCA